MRSSSIYVCQQCGYHSPQFLGKCPQCQTWNSLVEEVEETQKFKPKTGRPLDVKASIVNLVDIKKESYRRLSSGISEFDRVLGGGIVLGSVVLLSGDPGIGKSTLLLQLALNINSVNRAHRNIDDLISSGTPDDSKSFRNGVLYISGEESAHQIKMRSERIKKEANLAVLNELDVDIITQVIESAKPRLVIVDSIQTLVTSDLESVAGSVGQIRECAHRLQSLAKKLHIPIFIVGHVTKEGTVAGPKTLEHLVDVVLNLEGDTNSNFRILRGHKNRFGSTNEVGIFDMDSTGMVEVKNPSKIFLESASRHEDAPGSVVVPVLTGLRPILIEIQALVTKSNLAIPRRVATGIDSNRLMLLVAVLSKRLGLPLFDQDIFINVTGGLKVNDPACDLGICLAIISSYKDKVISPGISLIGEVGLLGELRNVKEIDKRITEAKKMGYINIISSDKTKSLSEVVKKVLE